MVTIILATTCQLFGLPAQLLQSIATVARYKSFVWYDRVPDFDRS